MYMQRLPYIAVLLSASLLSAHAQRGMGSRVSMPSSSHVGSSFAARPMPAFAPRPMPGPSAIGPHTVMGPHATMGPRFTGPMPGRTMGVAGPRIPAPSRAFAPRGGVRISSGFGNGFRHRRFRDFDGDFDDFRFRHRRPFFFGGVGFGSGCFNSFSPFCNSFGFGNGFGFSSGLAYAPAYPLDYGYQPQPPQQVIVAPDDNNRDLSLQVERLSNEVELLREDDLRSRNDARNAAPQPKGSLSAQEPPEYTVLVFRDGRKVSVQNYAIAGSTLWIIDERAAKKFPLSDLDLAATEQANNVNGVQFKMPSAPHSH